jgi:hypothetical protein
MRFGSTLAQIRNELSSSIIPKEDYPCRMARLFPKGVSHQLPAEGPCRLCVVVLTVGFLRALVAGKGWGQNKRQPMEQARGKHDSAAMLFILVWIIREYNH